MIRPATLDDIPRMLELGRAMHAESPVFRPYAWSDDKVRGLIDWLIHDRNGLALVCVDRGGEIIGGFLGVITEQFFSTDQVAQDYALFVDPGRRGALAGKQLLEAFRRWAADRGVPAVMGVSTGVSVEATGRLVEASGFQYFGRLYQFRGE